MSTITTLAPSSTGELPCYLCEDPCHMIALPDDTWGWAGRDGKITATDLRFRNLPGGTPYARLKELSDKIQAYFKLPKSKQTPQMAAEQDAWFREYSSLKTASEMGLSFHVHHVLAPKPAQERPSTVEHCDYPAWRRPSGWQCRKCGEHLGDDAAVGYAP